MKSLLLFASSVLCCFGAFADPSDSFIIPFTYIGAYNSNNPVAYYDENGTLAAVKAPSFVPDFLYHTWSELPGVIASNAITSLPSNLAYLNVSQSGNLNVSTITIGSSTNSPSFITGNTNWVDGQVYVNQTGRNVWVEAPCLMNPALLLGNSIYSLVVSNSSTDIITNSAAAPSLLALLVPANPGFVEGVVKPNGYWWFTNKSTAGTATMNGKGQYEVR